MKTIGLIGGTSWTSSMEYYRLFNEMVNRKLGSYHSCKCLMHSVDFEDIQRYQHEGRWDKIAEVMVDAAKRLEKGGADFVLIGANTLHKVADEITKHINIPILHIADAAAEEIKKNKLKSVGLLGTRFTMEQDFYRERLEKMHNIEVLVPNEEGINIVHSIIYNELVLGEIKDGSREKYLNVIDGLVSRGAEGIVLGCTEIPLLIKQEHCNIPVFDTTYIHSKHAVELALM